MRVILIIIAYLLTLWWPKTTVLIVQFNPVPDSVVQAVRVKIAKQYNAYVEITKGWDLPSFAYDSFAERYNAITLIKLLDNSFYADKVIGITDKPLTEITFFNPWGEDLFGYGEHGKQSCIISTAELDINNVIQEVQILAVHELGHTFGLNHCIDTTCYMWEGNGLTSGFGQTTHFCDSCKYKLKQLRK